MSRQSHSQRVSCIVAVYNGETYLRETIESLLAQTHRDVEIIVVDDGSTDGTADVLGRYGDRLRVLSQANAGVSTARNRGVAMSAGGLVCFLDGDDLLEPTKIALQAAALANSKFDFCDCHSTYFWSPEIPADVLHRDARYAEPFWHKVLPGHISTWMFRRELWDRVGGFQSHMRYSEDVDWFSRARDLPMRPLTLPDVLTHRRLHARNVTAKLGAEQAAGLADTLKAHLTRMRARRAG
jgi:glycosyltransferase involved in cell wall biosynthesis